MNTTHNTWVICSAEGYIKRGFETYSRELVELINLESPSAVLLVRSNYNLKNEANTLNIFNPLRLGSSFNTFIANIFKFRQTYYYHVAGFALSLFFHLIKKKPKTIYVLEFTIYKFLFWYKNKFNKNLKIIYFTGGQLVGKPPVDDSIYLHHVTPCYKDIALKMGFAKDKQFVIPHFSLTEVKQHNNAHELRKKLGISNNALIVLSVGTIDIGSKHMDYVIKEFAKLKGDKFLILLGHYYIETEQVIRIAQQTLKDTEYLITSVPKTEIDQYYQLADIVVSASRAEGFGLMYVEALANNKVPIVHDFPVSRYVLENYGIFEDLSMPDNLKNAIENYAKLHNEIQVENIQGYLKQKYSWSNLRNEYLKLILQ
jgi:1,2-diacylglycerol 3-alpha-glucosyltransferase